MTDAGHPKAPPALGLRTTPAEPERYGVREGKRPVPSGSSIPGRGFRSEGGVPTARTRAQAVERRCDRRPRAAVFPARTGRPDALMARREGAVDRGESNVPAAGARRAARTHGSECGQVVLARSPRGQTHLDNHRRQADEALADQREPEPCLDGRNAVPAPPSSGPASPGLRARVGRAAGSRPGPGAAFDGPQASLLAGHEGGCPGHGARGRAPSGRGARL